MQKTTKAARKAARSRFPLASTHIKQTKEALCQQPPKPQSTRRFMTKKGEPQPMEILKILK